MIKMNDSKIKLTVEIEVDIWELCETLDISVEQFAQLLRTKPEKTTNPLRFMIEREFRKRMQETFERGYLDEVQTI